MAKTNRHHLYFPASWYKTKLEKEFRCLPCCIVVLPIPLHDLIHVCTQARAKPTADKMATAIWAYKQGTCGCTHHEPYRGGGNSEHGQPHL